MLDLPDSPIRFILSKEKVAIVVVKVKSELRHWGRPSDIFGCLLGFKNCRIVDKSRCCATGTT